MFKKFSCAIVITMAMVMALGSVPARAAVDQEIGAVGDLLTGYVYDLRDTVERQGSAWENFLVLQNTTDKWIAAYLRFRSYEKSIEVWDHIILLSPYDVFYMDLSRAEDGVGVNLWSDDTETLVNSGLIASGETEYTGSFSSLLLEDCGYTEIGERLQWGHFEVIGIWQLPQTSHSLATALSAAYGSSDPDGDGETNIWDVLYAEWGDNDGFNDAIPSAPTAVEDCPNVLAGSMELGDTVTAQYNLYNLVAGEDFRTDGATTTHRDGLATGAMLFPKSVFLGLPYGTTNEVAAYYQPDWATTTGPTLRDGDATGGHESTCGFTWAENQAWSLKEFERTYYKGQVWDFFLNGAFGADIVTDLYLTFPGKYLHYLHIVGTCGAQTDEWPMWDNSTYPTINTYKNAVTDFRADIKTRWDDINNGPVNIRDGEIWDTDQNNPEELPPGSSPIPIPGIDQDIPHQTNSLRLLTDLFSVDDFFLVTEPFTKGQFVIGTFRYKSQQRKYDSEPGIDNVAPFTSAPFDEDFAAAMGATVRIHNNGGSSVYRSTMAPIHWKDWEQAPLAE